MKLNTTYRNTHTYIDTDTHAEGQWLTDTGSHTYYTNSHTDTHTEPITLIHTLTCTDTHSHLH